MFGKGATHKLKPKSLQSLTLTLDSEPLVSVQTVYSCTSTCLHYSPTHYHAPKKTTAAKKGAPAGGCLSLCIVELPPSNPLSPGLSDSGDDPNYKVLLLDVCFLFNIILKMFLCIFNEFLAMHEVCVHMTKHGIQGVFVHAEGD